MNSISLWMAIHRIEGYDRLLVRWWWVVLSLAVLMIVLTIWRLAVWVIVWWLKPRSNPSRLFQQLIREHRLSPVEKSLIEGMAPKLPKGSLSAILFVDPASWGWKQVEDTETRNSLEKLYVKIFGFPPDLTRT